MGEANRRAISQGFDDAEHRRLHLSVEEMRKEITRNSDAAARVRHYKVQDNVETVYGKASDLIECQRKINDTHYVDEPLDTGYKVADENWPYIPDEAHLIENEPAMRLSSSYSASKEYAKEIAASGNGMLIVEEMTKAEFEARYPDPASEEYESKHVCAVAGIEPLTTKKICAGEYEVTRNRDGKMFRIAKDINDRWYLTEAGVALGLGGHKTLAAAKAAIPA